MRVFGFKLFDRCADDATGYTCFHCGLPARAPARDWVSFEGGRKPVCCANCAAAAGMVIANGYADYYRERSRRDAGVVRAD